MSWDQKSNIHTCEKRHHDPDDSESHKRLRAATIVEEEPPSCSPLVLEGNPLNSTATSSSSQGSWRASSTTITSSGAVDTRSDKGEESPVEKHSCSSDMSSPENSRSDSLAITVEALEQFLLYKYNIRKPILRKDLLEIVGEDDQDQFAEILKKASEHIEAVFAVDLKEVDSSNHSYDLVSKLKLPNNGRVRIGRGLPKTGLLMNILGLIFMKGNCTTEDDIWEFLNKMEVYAGRKHCIYGEPKKLITEDFVQLQYLEYRQVPGNDPPRYEFLWGPRAYVETTKMRVLEFWAKVKGTVPSAFSPWYEEALQDEERARAIDAARAGTTAAGQDSMAPASPTPVTAEDFFYHQNNNSDITVGVFMEM